MKVRQRAFRPELCSRAEHRCYLGCLLAYQSWSSRSSSGCATVVALLQGARSTCMVAVPSPHRPPVTLERSVRMNRRRTSGLAEAAQELASITESRSGIDISTVVEYPVKNSIDEMVFAAMRELVSNVERHSRATHARVELRVVDDTCRLDVVDDGVGSSADALTHRLAEAEMGCAAGGRAGRCEAAGAR
jgi:hypothetical protein